MFAIHRSILLLKLDYNCMSETVPPTCLMRKPLHQLGPQIFFIPSVHTKNRAYCRRSCHNIAAGQWVLSGHLCVHLPLNLCMCLPQLSFTVASFLFVDTHTLGASIRGSS
ncbi:hypothetical protein GOODEAATRI_002416 [Goodea atripinnis]|uniref:Uncharacterized protein n=1 Tax=Goodea atripinnis TaxID=208336 RepID=A0ABV0PAX0_9TELE